MNTECVQPLESLLHIEATLGRNVLLNPEAHLSQPTINNSSADDYHLLGDDAVWLL
jgi:hypothetical protein